MNRRVGVSPEYNSPFVTAARTVNLAPMPVEFPYDVFFSRSAKDQAVVRPLAERWQADGVIRKGEGRRAKNEIQLPKLRSGDLSLSAVASARAGVAALDAKREAAR